MPPLTNITNMFDNWLNGVDKKSNVRMRIGISALCLSIWTCRNKIIFDKHKRVRFFAGYSASYTLDLTMVLPSPGGSAELFATG
jgi:hypothetical protein